MATRSTLAHVLWTVALAACGRVGFDSASQLGATDAGGDASSGPVALIAPTASVGVECGGFASTLGVSVTNTGDADLVISDASVGGGFTITTTMPLTIAAGGVQQVNLIAPMPVIGTDLAGSVIAATLALTTNEAGAPPRTVALSATVSGANLGFTDVGGVAITEIAFTNTAGACPTFETVTLTNSGDVAATVAFRDQANVDLGGFSSGMQTMMTGATAAVQVNPTTGGTTVCTGSGHFSYTVTGPSCTATPIVLQTTLDITGGSGFCFCP